MRVVVTGATGNVGTSLLRSLVTETKVETIVGIARRLPSLRLSKVSWQRADVARDDLGPLISGADAVVHLAWAIQPSRDLAETNRINVEGSRRVFEACAEAGVGNLVYASSVGAYSPADKTRRHDEQWPTEGIPDSFYSRQKAMVETLLSEFETRHPEMRVVRLRPAITLKRQAASEVRRLFFGPLVPPWAFDKRALQLVPFHPELQLQVVHSFDVGEAYRIALLGSARGAFNLAAEPIITSEFLESVLAAREVKTSPSLLRRLADWTWKLRMQPTPPGWLDMGVRAPLMDTGRARRELGWKPDFTAEECVTEILQGLRDKEGAPTPPLEPHAGGFARLRE
ncbi:MAG: NAD-dependent epimerase/dehydratase family protein [Actinomycetota bacterium]